MSSFMRASRDLACRRDGETGLLRRRLEHCRVRGTGEARAFVECGAPRVGAGRRHVRLEARLTRTGEGVEASRTRRPRWCTKALAKLGWQGALCFV